MGMISLRVALEDVSVAYLGGLNCGDVLIEGAVRDLLHDAGGCAPRFVVGGFANLYMSDGVCHCPVDATNLGLHFCVVHYSWWTVST